MPSKPLLRVPAGPLESGLLTLPDETSRYVARVHRRGVGDWVLLFDPATALEAEAQIVSAEGKRVVCSVGQTRPGDRCGVLGLHLVQGLGKGDKPDRVVRDAVVLGAQSVHLVVCDRSVAQPTERDGAKRDRLVRVAIEAARQCGRSNLPVIGFGQPVQTTLQEVDSFGRFVVLHTEDDLPALENALETPPRPAGVVLWVGPEGGFSERELELLASVGAAFCSIGQLVLRTELAAVVGLSRAGAWLCRSVPGKH